MLSDLSKSDLKRMGVNLLYPWQRAFLEDSEQFKLLVKAPQIGGSFVATKGVVLDCINPERAPQTWIVMSAGERQSKRLMEEKFKPHCKGLGIVFDSGFFEETSFTQHTARFANRSEIICLPANPRTATGDTGNVLLDEFAKHQDSQKIWGAMVTRTTRGFWMWVLSTFFGTANKFHEFAEMLDLHKGLDPLRIVRKNGWSGHWCMVHKAVREGMKLSPPTPEQRQEMIDELPGGLTEEQYAERVDDIDNGIELLRRRINDNDIWMQEYLGIPMVGGDPFFSLEVIRACEWVGASLESDHDPNAEYYGGWDVARFRHGSILTKLQAIADLRIVVRLRDIVGTMLRDQENVCRDLAAECVRTQIDKGGLGMQAAESLEADFPGRVEAIDFSKAGMKQDLAFGALKEFQEHLVRIPDYAPLREDLLSLRKFVTPAGKIRLDSVDEEKTGRHADYAWSLFLALAAARGSGVAAACIGESPDAPEPRRSRGWMPDETERPPSLMDPERKLEPMFA